MKSFISRHIILFVLFSFSFGHAQEGFITTSRNVQFINPSYHGVNMVSKAGVNYSRLTLERGLHILTINIYMEILLLKI